MGHELSIGITYARHCTKDDMTCKSSICTCFLLAMCTSFRSKKSIYFNAL